MMLRRDKAAVAAIVLLGLMILSAVFAPLFSPYDGNGDFAHQLLTPSFEHPFGTDDLGRDLFLRAMLGGRTSLAAGILAVMFAVFIGMTAGAVSGYRGGVVDTIIMRTTDLFLSIPVFFVILLLARLMTPGFLMICMLIAMTQWMEVARVVRSVVLATKQNEFVEAARALGVSDTRILFRHILSHTSGPVMVTATIGVAQAIMMESAVSFLGFGVQPPSASWGSMLTNAQSYLGVAPWMAVFPGLMIFITVVGCYALGDFLRSSLAPASSGPVSSVG
jgi:peptide/nickel transport system permease protein